MGLDTGWDLAWVELWLIVSGRVRLVMRDHVPWHRRVLLGRVGRHSLELLLILSPEHLSFPGLFIVQLLLCSLIGIDC